MANETALISVLTGIVDELREVAKDLARVGNILDGAPRDQVREVQYRVEAMRRNYEYLGSALETAQSADDAGPILKPAANAEQ